MTSETWVVRSKLGASDGTNGDFFAANVHVSGTTLLASAHWDGPDPPIQSGAVYVFARQNGAWFEQQKLVANSPEMFAFFGFALASDGDTTVVGAPNAHTAHGAAYVFERGAGGFGQTGELSANDPQPDVGFGSAVAISGDRAVVGASDDGEQGFRAGAAYVFRRDANGFEQEQKLVASDGATQRQFGAALAMQAAHVLVGAPADAEQTPTLAGSAYLFSWDGTSFGEQKLTSPDTAVNDRFGRALAIDGTTIAVGAPGDPASLVDGGAVYVFELSGQSISFARTLVASDAEPGDFFGGAIALSGDRLLVGAPSDDDRGDGSGAVYVFVRDAGVWSERQKIVPDDGDEGHAFGRSVSIDGTTAVVGGTRYTDGSGYVLTALGAGCGAASECGTDQCADGVCCAEPCAGMCRACNLEGSLGECGFVPAGSPDDTCIGQCDGAGGCQLENGQPCSQGSECTSGFCVDNVCCDRDCTEACASCALPESVGVCTLNDCSPYACDSAGSCRTSCSSSADCSAGNVCNASEQCVEPPPLSDAGSDDGCGCRVAGRSSDRGWAFWLALLAFLRRRRHATSSVQVAPSK